MDGVVTKKLCVALFCGICLWALCVEVLVVVEAESSETVLVPNDAEGEEEEIVLCFRMNYSCNNCKDKTGRKCGIFSDPAQAVGNCVAPKNGHNSLNDITTFSQCSTDLSGNSMLDMHTEHIATDIEDPIERLEIRRAYGQQVVSHNHCDRSYWEHMRQQIQQGNKADDSEAWFEGNNCTYDRLAYDRNMKVYNCLADVTNALNTDDEVIIEIIINAVEYKKEKLKLLTEAMPLCTEKELTFQTLEIIASFPNYQEQSQNYESKGEGEGELVI